MKWLPCKHEFIKSEFCVTMFYCNEWNVADAYIKFWLVISHLYVHVIYFSYFDTPENNTLILKGLQVTVHEDTVDSLYAQRTLSTNLLFWIKPWEYKIANVKFSSQCQINLDSLFYAST